MSLISIFVCDCPLINQYYRFIYISEWLWLDIHLRDEHISIFKSIIVYAFLSLIDVFMSTVNMYLKVSFTFLIVIREEIQIQIGSAKWSNIYFADSNKVWKQTWDGSWPSKGSLFRLVCVWGGVGACVIRSLMLRWS